MISTGVFTARQMFVCAIVGGPIGATYALVSNLRVAKRHREVSNALIFGLSSLLVFMMAWAFLPRYLWLALYFAGAAGLAEFSRRYRPFEKALKNGAIGRKSWDDTLRISVGSLVFFVGAAAAWSVFIDRMIQ